MKCYTCEVDGVWLGAVVVVFAEDEEQATRLIDAALVDARLQPQAPYQLHELDQRGAYVLWNGDY